MTVVRNLVGYECGMQWEILMGVKQQVGALTGPPPTCGRMHLLTRIIQQVSPEDDVGPW